MELMSDGDKMESLMGLESSQRKTIRSMLNGLMVLQKEGLFTNLETMCISNKENREIGMD